MKNNMISLEKGKIPPQAVDLEEAVLGALMIDARAIIDVEFLYDYMFYKEAHKLIYKAIIDLYIGGGISIDLLTVANKLRSESNLEAIGGDFHLVGLTRKVASSVNIEFNGRIIVQKYIQRELINSSSKIIEEAYREDSDVFDLLDTAYSRLNEVSEASIKKQETPFSDVVSDVLERGVKIYKQEIKPGIDTPIKFLTQKTGGLRDSEVKILAGRPGSGKTAFALAYALHASKQGTPTAVFSLEMSVEQLVSRILSMEYRIDGNKFNMHGLNVQDEMMIRNGQTKLNKLPLYIDDTASLSIEHFQVKAKRLVSKFGVKLIIIDYLQLMSGGNPKNREQEISKISRGIKLTAKELRIPIIALSQLSRAVETRGGSKRPMLSDLRDSGTLEQDADIVEFIYRPEYYGLTEWDDEERSPCEGEAEYIVAKNRNGGLVRGRMKFEGRYTLFSDIDPDEYIDGEFEEVRDDEPF